MKNIKHKAYSKINQYILRDTYKSGVYQEIYLYKINQERIWRKRVEIRAYYLGLITSYTNISFTKTRVKKNIINEIRKQKPLIKK